MNGFVQPGQAPQLLRVISSLRAAVHDTGLRFAHARQRAAARREFAQLDAAMQRDLGISPSEFGSYWAEHLGQAECTRRRIHATRCDSGMR
jgi:uncharacterized protein YjiS (DUF1127 family)